VFFPESPQDTQAANAVSTNTARLYNDVCIYHGGEMSTDGSIFRHDESALILIDYQPEMFDQVRSQPSENLLDLNVRLLVGAAKAFGMPIILSTVGVKMGINHSTKNSIRSLIPDVVEIDRSTMDAWEDTAFRNAVTATGRKRLIFGALWTEICLAFAVLEAKKAGHEVTFIVDAVGGRSQLIHEAAVQRLVQAGAVPNTALALVCELFRDWKTPLGGKATDVIVPYYKELAGQLAHAGSTSSGVIK
jgi:nicotinamidase-related amidase